MAIRHVTRTGSILPKKLLDETGILPNQGVFPEKNSNKIIIMPIRKNELSRPFASIDDEIKRKKIRFTMAKAVKDDTYTQ
jgi:hypothetical protein